MFRSYPDLSITTPLTPLTEGTPPTARAITVDVTLVSTSQYGDLVGLTDIVKTTAPSDVPRVAAEKASRTADEVIDRVTRDAIFSGGTYFTVTAADTLRTDIGTGDIMTGATLIRMRATMIKNKIPPFADGNYRFYCRTEQAYDLENDTTATSSWSASAQYDRGEVLVKGAIGTYRGITVIPTNTAPTFSSTQTVSAGVCVGNLKGWGTGDLQTLSTYYTPPGGQSDPLHQQEVVGWKVMFGAATLNNGYYLRVESYATPL